MTKKQKILAVVFGCVIGFINGFFGGGGGMVLVPCLAILFCFKQKVSHATAIAAILPTSIISVIVYFLGGAEGLKFTPTLTISIGVFIGGILGALALKKIDNKLLVKGFSLVMLIAGIKLLFP